MLYGAAFMKPFPVLTPLFLLGLTIVHAALAAESSASEPFHLYVPEKAWALDIDLQDFVISENMPGSPLPRPHGQSSGQPPYGHGRARAD